MPLIFFFNKTTREILNSSLNYNTSFIRVCLADYNPPVRGQCRLDMPLYWENNPILFPSSCLLIPALEADKLIAVEAHSSLDTTGARCVSGTQLLSVLFLLTVQQRPQW